MRIDVRDLSYGRGDRWEGEIGTGTCCAYAGEDGDSEEKFGGESHGSGEGDRLEGGLEGESGYVCSFETGDTAVG